MKKKIGTKLTPSNFLGFDAMDKRPIYAEYAMQYKVFIQSMKGYWLGERRVSYIVTALDECDAVTMAQLEFEEGKDTSLLAGQIYDIEPVLIKGSGFLLA